MLLQGVVDVQLDGEPAAKPIGCETSLTGQWLLQERVMPWDFHAITMERNVAWADAST